MHSMSTMYRVLIKYPQGSMCGSKLLSSQGFARRSINCAKLAHQSSLFRSLPISLAVRWKKSTSFCTLTLSNAYGQQG